jgi:hypothetical protein
VQALCCCYWKRIEGGKIRVRECQWNWWKRRNTKHNEPAREVTNKTFARRRYWSEQYKPRESRHDWLKRRRRRLLPSRPTDWLRLYSKHIGKGKKNKSKKKTRWRCMWVCMYGSTRGAHSERERDEEERIGGLQSPVIRAWRHHYSHLRTKNYTTPHTHEQASTPSSFTHTHTKIPRTANWKGAHTLKTLGRGERNSLI